MAQECELGEDFTPEEKRHLQSEIVKIKKEILKKRKLKGAVVGSSWMSIPVYCEIREVNVDEVFVEDEWGNKYWINTKDFISLHDYRG